MEPEIRYCSTSDGVSIAYYAMGEGPPLVIASPLIISNVNLVLLPEFHRAGRGFGRHQRVVRYDARGTGMSDRASLDFSLEARLRDTEAVIDHLELGRFDLVASTWGVPTAAAYAAKHPGRVRHLVLIDGSARGALFADLPVIRALASFREMADEAWEEYSISISNAFMGHRDPERALDNAERMRASISPEGVRRCYEATASIDVTPLLARIASPALVVSSGAFPLFDPEWSRELAARIPGARFAMRESAEVLLIDDACVAMIEEFLGVEAAPIPEPRPAAERSGGLRTILFTDIEANTALLQRLGDERWRALLREHERITREQLAAHGGAEVKHTGDGFMASFTSAARALDCAAALQRAFDAHNVTSEHALRVRIGVNAGEPIAEEHPGGQADLFGTAVTMAARIMSQAQGGEILVSDVVRQLVAGKGFLFADRGDAVLRGFEDAVRLWQLRLGEAR